MPPPSKSEKDVGEKRVVNYTVLQFQFFSKIFMCIFRVLDLLSGQKLT
jgi:hypothetical protein